MAPAMSVAERATRPVFLTRHPRRRPPFPVDLLRGIASLSVPFTKHCSLSPFNRKNYAIYRVYPLKQYDISFCSYVRYIVLKVAKMNVCTLSSKEEDCASTVVPKNLAFSCTE